MKVIILGNNMADVVTIKAKDFDKHYLQRRKQAYRIFPDGLTRMRVWEDGVEVDSDEVIVFPENSGIPHVTRGLDYSDLARMSDIDLHKDGMNSGGFFNRFKMFIDAGSTYYGKLAPFMGMIIAGIILTWALLTQG